MTLIIQRSFPAAIRNRTRLPHQFFAKSVQKRTVRSATQALGLWLRVVSIGALPITSFDETAAAALISVVAVKENMSAQVTVSLSTTSIPSPTASHGDLQTAAGYRELAAQAAASAATNAAQAKRFGELGQRELSALCNHLAQEATRRSEGCAANADFFEN
jgi:hypothetical protein